MQSITVKAKRTSTFISRLRESGVAILLHKTMLASQEEGSRKLLKVLRCTYGFAFKVLLRDLLSKVAVPVTTWRTVYRAHAFTDEDFLCVSKDCSVSDVGFSSR